MIGDPRGVEASSLPYPGVKANILIFHGGKASSITHSTLSIISSQLLKSY